MIKPASVLIFFALSAAAMAGERLSYNRDIRPILSDNCFACHGPDKANQQAGLRLDVRDAAIAPAESGTTAIVPGKVDQSALVARVFSDDDSEIMPPPDSRKKLSLQQKEILRAWVAQGAEYEQHWSFVPPVAGEVPAVNRADWPRNALDRFILARLEREGHEPSPEATKETLIRRVSLDLTGLPPSPAEVERFLADDSPDAYEKLVDRLLQSPHYGERMAIDWLDAARYADSNGYQVDRDRELWPWREWVIRAFNENKPFDQFTIEQLAGDLLPNATLDQRIATGFHRNHMLNEEGGIIAEEFLAEYTADRVETTAAVWLGQTFNCARCHDHKFDPFTQRDFYAMKAFFHNVPERGVGIYGNPIRHNAPPFIKLPAPAIEGEIAALKARLTTVNDQLAALSSQSSAGLEAWAQRLAEHTVAWEPIELLEATGGDQPPRIDAANGAIEIGPQETRANTIKIKARLPAGRITVLRFECAPAVSEASFQWSELQAAGKQPLKLRALAAGDALDPAETNQVLDKDRKTRVALSVKMDHAAQAVFGLETALESEDPAEIDLEIGVENAGGSTRWRMFAAKTEPDLLAPDRVLAVARKEPEKRTPEEQKQLVEFRLAQQPAHRRLSDEAQSLTKQIASAELEIPTTLVMEEMPEPRPTYVLLRGAYDKPGERVTAATPAVLPPLDEDLPRNRLGLAKWLVSPQNPLTARVTVNRFWQQAFGSGLVKTSEDFGSQGALPSHPELLDWLAQEFIHRGWDVKHLMKLLVTSATYRQQSHLTPTLLERDPENRLLARGPRFRLPAELIRDQALAASALLVETIGGPSVKPYHPPGLYEQVTAGSGYNVYVPGKGDDLHRRSLYTYWKRSVPHPAMLLFGAPFRETCTLRRPRSNTPLQALNLMNDPTYVEAARFLAQRMILEGGGAADSRLTYGFGLLLARAPKPEELRLLRRAYERSLAEFANDLSAAQALLAVGEKAANPDLDPAEHAAFSTVAGIMLCLDETVTRQ